MVYGDLPRGNYLLLCRCIQVVWCSPAQQAIHTARTDGRKRSVPLPCHLLVHEQAHLCDFGSFCHLLALPCSYLFPHHRRSYGVSFSLACVRRKSNKFSTRGTTRIGTRKARQIHSVVGQGELRSSYALRRLRRGRHLFARPLGRRYSPKLAHGASILRTLPPSQVLHELVHPRCVPACQVDSGRIYATSVLPARRTKGLPHPDRPYLQICLFRPVCAEPRRKCFLWLNIGNSSSNSTNNGATVGSSSLVHNCCRA